MEIDLGIPGLSDFEEVGAGGFSRVYRAREEGADRPVAVKVLNSRVDSDSAQRRFEREARAAGKLSDHPHVVPLHASGVTRDGHPYLVLDFLPGGSLGERVRRNGPMPLAQVIEIGVKLAGALETAHRAGIFHRDVKPENVLLSRFGEPQITDFGIAAVVGGYETRSGFFSLSLAHAPPEIIAAQPGFKPAPTSDVYSLGSTLFALFTGEAPFPHHEGELLPALIARIVSEPVPDLRRLGVPGPVAAVVERAMAKSPADRYQRMADVGYDLVNAAASLGLTVRPPVIEGDEVDTLDLGNSVVAPAAFSTTDPGAVTVPPGGVPLSDATVGIAPIAPIAHDPGSLTAPSSAAPPPPPPRLPAGERADTSGATKPRRRLLVPVLAVIALLAVGAGVAVAMTGDGGDDDERAGGGDTTTTVDTGASTTTVTTLGASIDLGSGEVRLGEVSAEVSTPVFVGEAATFTASGSGVSDESVTWSFGDGSVGTGASTTHTYSAAGLIAATFRVGSGTPETLRFTVHEDPLALIDIPGVARNGDAYVVGTSEVQLTSVSTGISDDDVIYEWFIDDVGVSNAAQFGWTFPTTQLEYVVELRVRHDELEGFYGTTDEFFSIARVIVQVFPGLAPPATVRPPTTTTRPPTGGTQPPSTQSTSPPPTQPPATTPPPTTPPTVAPQLVAVPNVVGDSRVSAYGRIQAAGLEVSSSSGSTTSCGGFGPDQVVSQNPTGGMVPAGSVVTITWCQ